MKDRKDTLLELRKDINSIVDLFYTQKVGDGYQHLMNLLIKFEDYLQIIYREANEEQKVIIFNKDINPMLEHIMEAMQTRDIVLLCDLLKYELIDLLEKNI